jgi:hypothetical protein
MDIKEYDELLKTKLLEQRQEWAKISDKSREAHLRDKELDFRGNWSEQEIIELLQSAGEKYQMPKYGYVIVQSTQVKVPISKVSEVKKCTLELELTGKLTVEDVMNKLRGLGLTVTKL